MQSMYKYELEDLLRFVEQQRRIRIIQNFKIDYMKTNYPYKLFLAMMFCLVAVSCRDKITINLAQMTMEEIFEFYGEDYAEYTHQGHNYSPWGKDDFISLWGLKDGSMWVGYYQLCPPKKLVEFLDSDTIETVWDKKQAKLDKMWVSQIRKTKAGYYCGTELYYKNDDNIWSRPCIYFTSNGEVKRYPGYITPWWEDTYMIGRQANSGYTDFQESEKNGSYCCDAYGNLLYYHEEPKWYTMHFHSIDDERMVVSGDGIQSEGAAFLISVSDMIFITCGRSSKYKFTKRIVRKTLDLTRGKEWETELPITTKFNRITVLDTLNSVWKIQAEDDDGLNKSIYHVNIETGELVN